MNNKYYHILILGISATLSAIILFHFTKEKRQHRFGSRVFKAVSGWGYDILVDDKLSRREQAEKTAQLIINKMERGEPPTVTTFELQQFYNINDTTNAGQ